MKTDLYVRFDQMNWPRISSNKIHEILWRCRYGKPSREDIFMALSMAEAYSALVGKTQKQRNHICKVLKSLPQR